MENARPPWARRCLGPVWERWLSPAREEPRTWAGTRLPWLSTLAVLIFVMVGSGYAARNQVDREALDPFARALLSVGTALLLFRHRHPRIVAIGTAATCAVYFAAGYPYGPVFLIIALGTFAAIVAGYRKVAWCALGGLWASHLLVAHWLYHWLPPHKGPEPWGQEIGNARRALGDLDGAATAYRRALNHHRYRMPRTGWAWCWCSSGNCSGGVAGWNWRRATPASSKRS